MNSHKIYRYMVMLLPLVYIIHNYEEWFVMHSHAVQISGMMPKFLATYLKLGESNLIDLFRIAVIVASVLPFLAVPYLLGDLSPIRVKVAITIVFATIINAISHIASSFVLGMPSPGIFSSLILLLPYSILFIMILTRLVKLSRSSYFTLAGLAIVLYFIAISISWFVGVLIV